MIPKNFPDFKVSSPLLPAVTAALAAAGLVTSAQAQIQTAEDLLVNIDATALADGTLTSIVNSGTLGGVFEARGGGTTVPVVALEGGTRGIRLDGTDYMQLADAVGGTLIFPPDGIVGADPTRSIEVWALNPNVANEETLVSWGRRGGPDGSNIAFNFGNDFRWGAVGHWGGDGPDLGWNDAGGNPEPNKWHHLVYTYDGTTTRVYTNGVLANSESLGAGVINTHPATSINLGAQLEADGIAVTAGLRGSLTMARVRIHDGVLTDEQILNNYTTERDAFVDPEPPMPPTPQPLTELPAHRYSFNEAATAEAMGQMFQDSVGTAHGTVLGAGAQFTGERLTLPGGAGDSAAYGDLPNGLLSVNSTNNAGDGEVSIEGWVRVTGSRTWSRIFDMGSTTGGDNGELSGPGGGGEGRDYLFLSAQMGDNVGIHRLEVRNEDPAGGGITTADAPSPGTFNNDLHVVVTWRESTGEIKAYENAAEVASMIVDEPMSDIRDVNVWLGRSNWTVDQNAQIEYDEFRIYPSVLSRNQVLGNFQAGPETVNTGNEPVMILGQPASLIGYDTIPATFTARVAGSPPISFQWLRDGAAILNASNRVYTFPATLADNGAAFSVVVSNFTGGVANVITSSVATLTVVTQAVTLRHRYAFDEEIGAVTADVACGADGEVLGGAAFTGDGKLITDGQDDYVNLPNGIISALNNATFEFWVTCNDGRSWARLFDFGNSTGGEDNQGNGVDYLFFAPRGPANLRFEAKPADAGPSPILIGGGPVITNEEVHIVISYNVDGRWVRVFTNGVEVASGPVTVPLSSINDVNNWLARSQFAADVNLAAVYNEVRIWEGAMTPAQVEASRAAGPDAVIRGGCSLLIARAEDGRVKLSWSIAARDFFLESSSVLGPNASWLPVNEVPVEEGRFQTVTVAADAAAAFYRLSR